MACSKVNFTIPLPKPKKYTFQKMFTYNLTYFRVTTILRNYSNTVRKLQKIKYKYNYNKNQLRAIYKHKYKKGQCIY